MPSEVPANLLLPLQCRAANGVPKVIVIGGSAGSFRPLKALLEWLPEQLPVAVAIAIHLPRIRDHKSALPHLLQSSCKLPVAWARDGEELKASTVRIAPQDGDLLLTAAGLWHMAAPTGRSRPSVDRLFTSVAAACGANCLGVVLSGYLRDGADGARAVHDVGGSLLIHEPDGEKESSMPRAALGASEAGLVVRSSLLGPALVSLLSAHGVQAWFRVWRRSPYAKTAAIDAFG